MIQFIAMINNQDLSTCSPHPPKKFHKKKKRRNRIQARATYHWKDPLLVFDNGNRGWSFSHSYFTRTLSLAERRSENSIDLVFSKKLKKIKWVWRAGSRFRCALPFRLRSVYMRCVLQDAIKHKDIKFFWGKIDSLNRKNHIVLTP